MATRGRKKGADKNGKDGDVQDNQFKIDLDAARAEAKVSKARIDDLEAKLQRFIDAKDGAGAVIPPAAGDEPEEQLRHGTFASFKRAGSAAQGYTYIRCTGTLNEMAEEIQASQEAARPLTGGHGHPMMTKTRRTAWTPLRPKRRCESGAVTRSGAGHACIDNVVPHLNGLDASQTKAPVQVRGQ